MSKRINVNPGAYKVAGRERPGKDVPADIERQTYTKKKSEEEKSAPPPRPARRQKLTMVAGQAGSSAVPGASGREKK